ncbi:MAG: hypothetical protein EF806_05420 [Candidatus Methanoliparum thermophilum]|uniref:Uncharacterized protein n=1 Tax=Methanoliparum thermophilum TaxID=2491083 RepID=A0A520KR56_METT2|nr:hypothetical protein [Candidatus Methanoliparum sp. LAM-1]RZN64061.1 MAG: hypothetical protein EF806_05420 [Candidatus Methanoliparum thermophilum]BDC35684.1 hypothetical protein MTLP_03660 [Candidatus Methanoliparum sp. LAM-1]
MFKKIGKMLRDENAMPYVMEMFNQIFTCCGIIPCLADISDVCITGMFDTVNICFRTCFGIIPLTQICLGK